MKPRPASNLLRWYPLWLAAALWLQAPAAEPAQSDAGYAVLDLPEARRSFISGAVNALARTPDGLLFVGSNRLSVYDGHNWQRIELPGTSRFLSLAPDPAVGSGGRVWFSADGALGYVERNRNGDWQLVSLAAPLAAAGIRELSDIRHVRPDGRGGAVFVTRSHVLRWDGRRFAIQTLPSPPRLFVFDYRDAVHIYQDGVGLLRVTAQGTEVWLAESELPERQPVTGLVELPGGETLALFFNDEIYRRDRSGRWTRLQQLAPILKGRRPLHTARVDADTIALGLAYGGVLLCRNDGSMAGLVNSQSGLPDDNTDALLSDGAGGLWIGTGTGLVRLAGAGRASLFDQRARIANGFIRQVLEHRGRPVVITSRRAYELVATAPTEPARFNRVEMIWPQLRAGAVLGDQLWLGGTGGFWREEAGTAVHEPAGGPDVFQILAPTWLPGGLVYLDRTSLRAFVPAAGGGWRSYDLGHKIDSLPASTLEDDSGRLWVSSRDGHVYVHAWDPAARALQRIAHHPPGEGGLPAGMQRPGLGLLDGAVALFADNDTLVSSDPAAGFTRVPGLGDFSVDATVRLADGSALWSVQYRPAGSGAPHALIRVRRDRVTGAIGWEPVTAPGLDHIAEVTSLSVTGPAGREILWVGGENALLRLEPSALLPAGPVPGVHLQRVSYNSSHRAPLAADTTVQFQSSVNQLDFRFAAPVEHPGLLFQTRLAGVEQAWSPPHSAPQHEFTGLAAGAYEFQVRAVDRFGRTGPATTYPFVLAAPWYRNPPALLLWAVLLILAVRGLVKWRTRRLKVQAARLEQLVNERTRELSLSNTARSDFLDSFSHEVRRPINGILSLIRQLEESSLDDHQREQARLLHHGTESLARVCDEVLNFSSIEYGTMTLEERPFQFGELLATTLAGTGEGTRPTVTLAPDFTDGFIGDEAKLRTILGNFVANALKHAVGAPVEIAVSCTDTTGGTTNVLIEVADGGPGVPPEEQELIFKRFVRGSHAKRNGVPGTGIGLASSRAIARLMGGNVGVESPSEFAHRHGWPGPGSTFFVHVPLRRAPVAPQGDDSGPSGMRVKPFSIA